MQKQFLQSMRVKKRFINLFFVQCSFSDDVRRIHYVHIWILSALSISKGFALDFKFEIVVNIVWTIYIYAVSVEKNHIAKIIFIRSIYY